MLDTLDMSDDTMLDMSVIFEDIVCIYLDTAFTSLSFAQLDKSSCVMKLDTASDTIDDTSSKVVLLDKAESTAFDKSDTAFDNSLREAFFFNASSIVVLVKCDLSHLPPLCGLTHSYS